MFWNTWKYLWSRQVFCSNIFISPHLWLQCSVGSIESILLLVLVLSIFPLFAAFHIWPSSSRSHQAGHQIQKEPAPSQRRQFLARSRNGEVASSDPDNDTPPLLRPLSGWFEWKPSCGLQSIPSGRGSAGFSALYLRENLMPPLGKANNLYHPSRQWLNLSKILTNLDKHQQLWHWSVMWGVLCPQFFFDILVYLLIGCYVEL